MQELLVILVICVVLLYWQSAMRSKERAIAAARKECKLCGVQLLDQTVHQTRVSLSRDADGNMRVWRNYTFDYTETGEDRFKGSVTLLGQRILRIAMETFNPVIH